MAGLERLLKSRRWWKRAQPFPHFVGYDVFAPEVLRDLVQGFREIVDRGLCSNSSSGKLSRSIAGYDAYGLGLREDNAGPFEIFLSRAWHDALAALVGVRATGHINCGLHYHEPGSESGAVHNDLNPGWFVDYPSASGVRVARHELCSYKHGSVSRPGLASRETVRAAAMIFYLNNEEWFPGAGGGTGLYRHRDDPVGRPSAVVPPLDNSLLLFECTPSSYHTFLTNPGCARSSVILWLHRTRVDAEARWGRERISIWPRD